MSKSFQLVILVFICGHAVVAQNSESFYKTEYEPRNSGSFGKSVALLSFGAGFPNVIDNFRNGQSGFPPLYAKFEHGFMRDEIGLGGHISSGWGSFNSINNSKANFAALSIGSLVFYHFNKLIPAKKLDLYIGVGLGYRYIWYRTDDPVILKENSDDDVLGMIKLGARYYINPKFSFFGETGYDGMSGLNFGISLNLK